MNLYVLKSFKRGYKKEVSIFSYNNVSYRHRIYTGDVNIFLNIMRLRCRYIRQNPNHEDIYASFVSQYLSSSKHNLFEMMTWKIDFVIALFFKRL